MIFTYHNDKAIKDKYLRRVQEHAAADEIVKGWYWGNGKGCAIGCTVHGSNHTDYEKELGIPVWLARLEDMIFEGLPENEAKMFPLEFLQSIRIGVTERELDMVNWKFCAFLTRGNIELVEELDIGSDLKLQVLAAIQRVLKLYDEAIATGEWSRDAVRGDAASAAAVYAGGAAAVYAGGGGGAASSAYSHYKVTLLELLKEA